MLLFRFAGGAAEAAAGGGRAPPYGRHGPKSKPKSKSKSKPKPKPRSPSPNQSPIPRWTSSPSPNQSPIPIWTSSPSPNQSPTKNWTSSPSPTQSPTKVRDFKSKSKQLDFKVQVQADWTSCASLVSCHHSRRFAVTVSALNYVPVYSSPFQESISYSWFCTGPILVTGDSAGFLLLTT